MSIRVLVVDDSSFMRRLLTRAIESDPGMELAGVARDGAEAVEMLARVDPDVMTLDIEMPRKNGLEVLREARRAHAKRPAVVMCSSLTVQGSDATLEALRLGASDFIAKDTSFSVSDGEGFLTELLSKIRAVAPRALVGRAVPAAAVRRPAASDVVMPSRPRVVVVGSSTGGPPVLEQLIRSLPGDFPVPVVIAQHMPELFTRGLAQRLDTMTPLSVRLSESGQSLRRGTVTIGLGGRHVLVGSRGGVDRVVVSDEPADALYKPDVDELFVSAAETFGSGVVGVVLTGMGDDGADGAGRIRSAGGVVLAQDEESSVVYGMPRAVAERGHASFVGTPAELFSMVASLGTGGGAVRRSA